MSELRVVTMIDLEEIDLSAAPGRALVLAKSVLTRRTLRRYLHADKVFPAGSGHWHHYVVKKGWLDQKVISVEERFVEQHGIRA